MPSAARSFAAFTPGELVAAYLDCRRAKRNTASALAFELEQESNLIALQESLLDATWRPGRAICFVITRPKPREVWAAPFADRIVHHLLYNRIGPGIERAFIADSCACIEDRGTLYAARRLEHHARSITAGWQRRAHYLKCDLSSFFVSIDKTILDRQLERRIACSWWLGLARTILHHDPRANVDVRGNRARLALIPPAKSLFQQPAHRGLPIGNLTSQFFANVYLDDLDQFIKHRLRAQHYVRYVDDFVLLHRDPAQLNAWRTEIEAFLETRLRLRLNPTKTILQPVHRGIDFVGQVIAPHRRTLRRRTLHAAISRVRTMPAANVAAAATSYLGLARQATRNHHDRCRIANAARQRGFAVDHRITKVYP